MELAKRRAPRIWEKYHEGLEFPAWSDERARRWVESLTRFVEWFLIPDWTIPNFHKEWFYLLVRYQFLCLMAPRDHAKTTIVSVYYPLWRILMEPNSTIMLAASTVSMAQVPLRGIKGHLEQNPLILAGFGNVKPSEGSKWTDTEIIVARSDFALTHASVTTIGVGGSVLSRRVTNGFIVADDIVQDDEVLTENGRKRIENWVDGVLIPVLEPDEQAIFTGTRKHEEDYYAKLFSNAEYHAEVFDAIVEEDEGGEWKRSLWPAKWSVKRLAARRRVQGTLQFNRNYRNQVLGDADSKFPMKWFTGEQGTRGCYDYDAHIRDTHWTNEWTKVIAVDLAAGKTDEHSFFVAMVLGLDDNGDVHFMNMARGHFPFPDQVKLIIDMYDRFVPDWVVVENNAYQQAMVEALPAEAPRVPVVPHTTTRKKNDPSEGVLMLQPLIEAGRMRFPMGDAVSRDMSEIIIGELNRFGATKHNDTVMAMWMGVARLVEATGENEEVSARVL